MSIRLEARNRGNIRLDMDNASLAAKYAREAGAAEKAAELSAANAAGAAERADAAAEAALRAEAGAQSAAVHLPQPGENGTWLVWDQAGDSYMDSGENCTGVQGERGLKGDTGDKGDKGDTGSKGDDGVSPTVTVTDITGGHRVTITDANHPQGQPFDVMDGEVAQEDFDELSGDVDDLKSAMVHNDDCLFITSDSMSVSGVTIEKINATSFRVYGIATANRYITLFNGIENDTTSASTAKKIVPAGEYEVTINTNLPTIKLRYTAGKWSSAAALENGDVVFSSSVGISFLTNNNVNYGTSESPTIVEIRIKRKIVSAVPWLLIPSGNDDTPAIWLNLFHYGQCELSEGEYKISNLIMPENSILSGLGNNTVITVISNNGIYPRSGCVVRDLSLNGGGQDDIIPTEAGNSNGIVISVENVRRVRVDNCYIHGFSGAAIIATDIGTGIRTDIVISRCNPWYNFYGIYFRRAAEFIMVSDCNICCNYYGILDRGANNKFSNCDIDSNIINAQIELSAEGSNGGHGSMVGCSFNHSNNRGNDGYSLIIKDSGRELISGCNFYYGKTRLENTSGNVFSGCGYGGENIGIEIIDGACSIFSGCCFVSRTEAKITRTNNDKAVFVNCYTRQGLTVT